MKHVSSWWLALVLGIALLAPLLANDAPLVARVDGTLRFPAFASYFGRAEVGPHPELSQTWREWWAQLDPRDGDFAVMPPWPYGPLMDRDPGRADEGPSLAHPLGRDGLGRDVLARLIWGTATAVRIGVGSVAVALLLGVPLGAAAGYCGGVLDALIGIVIEVFLCFPALFLVLAAAAFFGSSATAVVLVLGAVYWTGVARIVRGEFLSLRSREFVLAARGLGVGHLRLVLRHMLPSALPPVAVTAAFLFAGAIVAEATLTFLGLSSGGHESWGTLLAEGKSSALRGAWHLWLFPALAVAGTVWSLQSTAGRWRTEA